MKNKINKTNINSITKDRLMITTFSINKHENNNI